MNASATTESVLAERRGPVLLLTLNRPDRSNAWNADVEAAYFTHLDAAEADPEVRAIVLTGAGGGFCVGADFDDLQSDSAADLSMFDRPRPRSFPLTVRKPLIAAINGGVAGLGLVQALYCDVRFATPQAKFTTAFVRRGLIAEYGSAWLLPRIVGTSRALDLLLSGRVLRGEEAHSIGLVDHLREPDLLVEEAVAYATELATACSPTAMAVIKRQVFDDLDRNFPAAFEDAETKIRESFTRSDVKEGIASYLEDRPPEFLPLAPPSGEGAAP